MTLQELQEIITIFRKERGWMESDTPYILAKSVFVESAELLECYQKENQVDQEAVRGEVADVLMYALSLCYDAGWDPAEVITKKLEDVARRYPKVIE